MNPLLIHGLLFGLSAICSIAGAHAGPQGASSQAIPQASSPQEAIQQATSPQETIPQATGPQTISPKAKPQTEQTVGLQVPEKIAHKSPQKVGTTAASINASDPILGKIKLPPGFHIDYYARELLCPRQLTVSHTGTVFVGTRLEQNGCVYALVDKDHDGTAEKTYIIGGMLHSPNGVAFRDGSLYVAEINRILRYDQIENNLDHPPAPAVVTESYPRDKHHGWKYIRFGPDGKLYVPVGAPCNVCVKGNDIYASITRINADGSDRRLFASGVRNTVGFDWDPRTNELWFTDNGRDLLGDDLPPDELNHAPKPGMHFGFPYRYGMNVPDPTYGDAPPLVFTPPVQPLGAHVASLGMRFYRGEMFPGEYKNSIIIAEHGSWNRSKKVGYRITNVRLKGDKAVSYSPFAEGWMDQATQAVRGRPVDIMEMPDGAILVSDDFAGVIYRIWYSPPQSKTHR